MDLLRLNCGVWHIHSVCLKVLMMFNGQGSSLGLLGLKKIKCNDDIDVKLSLREIDIPIEPNY